MIAPAPQPSYRLIPSQFPPIGLFDTVATTADLEAVMELAGWSNDRLVPERVKRLPPEDLVLNRPNASVVLAAFLHAAPSGGRFNGPDLGAWYAAASVRTTIAEVAHHLRREVLARGLAEGARTYRSYVARLEGDYRDISGTRPDLHAAGDYAAGQAFGEALRAEGGDGIVYDSVRHAGGTNVCAYRPRNIHDVTQAEHFEIRVRAAERRIEAVRLAS